MSKRGRKRRNVNGILVLDKGLGLSSNAALQEVKRLFDAQKAGHTGSLDPLASGVLPLCFGESTKFSQYLLDANKRYLTTIKLGITTETGDAEGEVVEEKPVPVMSDTELESALDGFRGEIDQIPSMYSAIKIDGQPLYKLARQGIVIDRPSRTVNIFELTLLGRTEDTIELEILCSKGTYVRTLAEDLGAVLGCGGHVIALRRLASGPFELAAAVTFEELKALKGEDDFAAIESKLQSSATAVADWPAIVLTELSTTFIKQGQAVQVPKAPTSGWVRLFSESADAAINTEVTEHGVFIGVGEIDEDGKVAPRRLVVT